MFEVDGNEVENGVPHIWRGGWQFARNGAKCAPAQHGVRLTSRKFVKLASRTERPKVVWKGIHLFRSSKFYCTWKHHKREAIPVQSWTASLTDSGAPTKDLAPELRRLVRGVCSLLLHSKVGVTTSPWKRNLGQSTTSQNQSSPGIIVEILACNNVPSKIAPLSSLVWLRFLAKNDKRRLIKLFPVLFLFGWVRIYSFVLHLVETGIIKTGRPTACSWRLSTAQHVPKYWNYSVHTSNGVP